METYTITPAKPADAAAILDYLKQLDPKQYMVLLSCYYNRPNNPPIPVFILKL